MSDLISRQAAIDAIQKNIDEMRHNEKYHANLVRLNGELIIDGLEIALALVKAVPSVQPETCEGCKHLGKWEKEVEYGFPSPCTDCKRRAEDNYER